MAASKDAGLADDTGCPRRDWQKLPVVVELHEFRTPSIGWRGSPGERLMPTRNVNLTDRFDQFVEEQIHAGRYRNASEVMRAGLHLLEQQTLEEQQKLALLRSLASEAFDQLDQGGGIEINGQRQLANFIGKIGGRAAKSVKRRAARGG
jgi:antitoxin ParD1/3/4